MNKLTIAMMVVFVYGCTATGKPAFEKAEVLERMGNKPSTPEWTYGSEAMKMEGTDVVFIHTMSMSGNSRPEACMQSAELGAKAAFLQHIQTGITTSGQVNDQGATSDPAYESLTAFLAQGKISGAKTLEKYYEKRVESDAVTADRVVKLHCAVKVAIKKSELEKQLQAALGNGGNKEIREKLLGAQKQFIENIGEETTQPAH